MPNLKKKQKTNFWLCILQDIDIKVHIFPERIFFLSMCFTLQALATDLIRVYGIRSSADEVRGVIFCGVGVSRGVLLLWVDNNKFLRG